MSDNNMLGAFELLVKRYDGGAVSQVLFKPASRGAYMRPGCTQPGPVPLSVLCSSQACFDDISQKPAQARARTLFLFLLLPAKTTSCTW
eukprot:559929-Pleurochrysis_carterae.AAC.1